MGVLATVLDGILAAVSQRPFWTARQFNNETQLRELIRKKSSEWLEQFEKPVDSEPESRSGMLKTIRIFATERQQTWLVVDPWRAYCILDDRKWEEPRLQWMKRLEDVLPVQADENWSEETGVLHFGNMPKGWFYSKELFTDQSAADAIGHFLMAPRHSPLTVTRPDGTAQL